MTPEAGLAVAGVAGYMAGAIPFGLALSKSCGYDLRAIGSGNIGATNVLRTGRKDLALLTLFLDSAKGAVAALLAARWLGPDAALLAGCLAVVGHDFPIWLGLRGGKGVACTLGVMLALSWPVGLAACAGWLVVAAVTRYSSLSALASLSAAPVCAWWWLEDPRRAAAFAALAALAFVRHHDNIHRLIAGTETKIGERKTRA